MVLKLVIAQTPKLHVHHSLIMTFASLHNQGYMILKTKQKKITNLSLQEEECLTEERSGSR